MAKLSENGRKVLDYVRSMRGQNITADDVADATGLSSRQANAIITSAFQKKGLMKRIPAEIELDNGLHKPVKLIVETEAGMAYDPDAAEEPVVDDDED